MATISKKHMEELTVYFERMTRYDNHYDDALVALRKAWELLVYYNDTTDTGDLIHVNDHFDGRRENDAPCCRLASAMLENLWSAINSACHYRPEQATQSSGRKKNAFCEWAHDSVEPFQAYLRHIEIPQELHHLESRINSVLSFFSKPYTLYPQEPISGKESFLDQLVVRMNACQSPDGKALCMRMIVEMILREKLISHNAFRSAHSNLSDLINGTRNLGKDNNPFCFDDANDAEQIQRDANLIVHWNSSAMSDDDANDKLRRREIYLAHLISHYIGEHSDTPKAHEYAIGIITAQERSHIASVATLTVSAIVVVIIIVGFIHLHEFWRFLTNDPAPCISEATTYTDNLIVSAPEISVMVNDEALLADGTVYTVTPECSFTISAKCNTEPSLRYAKDKGYMHSIGLEPNEFGMALLQYQFFSCDENGSNEKGMQRYSLINTYEAPIAQSFAPGYYMLRVQAVGAADGLDQGAGKKLCSNTLWQTFRFVVPANDGQWAVSNDSTGAIADNGRSMPVKAGQRIAVAYSNSMPGNITLAMAWDEDSFTELGEKYFVTPQLAEGFHSLHLRALQGMMLLSESSFLCAFTSQENQSSINMTVQLGSVICINEQSLIVSDGEKLTIAAQSANGVKAIEWYYEDTQSGGKTTQEHSNGNACSITLEKSEQPKRILQIEAIENR